MKLGVAGITGRVGRLIEEELRHLRQNSDRSRAFKSGGGMDIDLVAGLSRRSGQTGIIKIYSENDIESFLTACDVIIDFSSPELSRSLVGSLARLSDSVRAGPSSVPLRSGPALVIGTTGLNQEDEVEIRSLSNRVPIVYAANMSLGVNLLASLVRKSAQILGEEWDIEISETHHRYKKDAPSGTAYALGEAAAAGRERNLNTLATYPHSNNGEQRRRGQIGFSVQRGGNVVGEHEVTFYGESERISLSHRAENRSLFARGALHAAQWVRHQGPGLYTMGDVIGADVIGDDVIGDDI